MIGCVIEGVPACGNGCGCGTEYASGNAPGLASRITKATAPGTGSGREGETIYVLEGRLVSASEYKLTKRLRKKKEIEDRKATKSILKYL